VSLQKPQRWLSTLDYNCSNPEDLKKVGVWIDQCRAHFKSQKTIVLLEGNLGAGKTELVRQYLLMHAFNGVMSPTFSIINQYQVKESEVTHVDLYRTENEQEVESSGFWELFSAEQGLVFIEWSSKLGEGDPSKNFPKGWQIISIHLLPQADQSRIISAEVLM
jgi:tRNA threonylcarbamoyladenosine biosynthesis protein TsaE